MDLLAESITEVAVSGEIANTDRVLNIAYGIDRNFLFGAAVSMQSVVMHNPDLAVKFHSDTGTQLNGRMLHKTTVSGWGRYQ